MEDENIDEKYEFTAPKYYFDFNQQVECDSDMYFDCPSETPVSVRKRRNNYNIPESSTCIKSEESLPEGKLASSSKSENKNFVRAINEGVTRSSPRLQEKAMNSPSTTVPTSSKKNKTSLRSLSAKVSLKTCGLPHIRKLSRSSNRGSLRISNRLQMAVSNYLQENKAKKEKPEAKLTTTKPSEFKFETDKRIRKRSLSADVEAVEFTKILRSNSVCYAKEACKGPTVPKPFKLSGMPKKQDSSNEFRSLAELNLKFQTQTPQRFRTKRKSGEEELSHNKSKRIGLTVPQTPRLLSSLRTRNVAYLSQKELEEQELWEMQKHRFKAAPFNKKVLEAPKNKYLPEKKLLPDRFIIPDKPPRRTMQLRSMKENVDDSICSVSSSSRHDSSHNSSSLMWNKKPTELKPFSFDERDIETRKKKEVKIKKIIQEEKKMAEFTANPLPVLVTTVGLPPKKKLKETQVKEFSLQSDVRGLKKKEMWEQELEEKEKMESMSRTFHAQPDTVLHKEPFVPEKSKKPLTDISSFSLNTDRRAVEREAFQIHQKQVEDKLMSQKRLLEAKRAEEEKVEIAKMRKIAVHRAKPVPYYKHIEIKSSDKPATIPESPDFATNYRLRTRKNSYRPSGNEATLFSE